MPIPTPIPQALTTLSAVKESLGLADTSKDSLLVNYINRVTLWIENYTHRKLVARNYNGKGATQFTAISPAVANEDYIYLDGSRAYLNDAGYTEFYLPAYPIQRSGTGVVTFQLAVLQNRGSTLSGGETWDTTSYVEWDQYMVDNDNGIIRFLGDIQFEGYRDYRIACTAGLYDTSYPNVPWVPPDLESVCVELVKQMYRDSRTVTSEHIGSVSRSYDINVKDPHIFGILAQYTRIVL